MCEARVFIATNDHQEEIMRDVVLVQPEDDKLLLVNLLGEQKLVKGSIKKIDFIKHTLVLESTEA